MDNNYEALNLTQPESEIDPFTEDRYRQFYRFLPAGTRSVLDIGCNTGRGGSVLKALDGSLKIYGLDAVRDRLDRLPKDVYEEGVHGYSTKIPNEDGTYDAVVAGEFIEHIYQADVDQTLGEIFRVLKIGGRLLLTTPNPETPRAQHSWRGTCIATLPRHTQAQVADGGLFAGEGIRQRQGVSLCGQPFPPADLWQLSGHGRQVLSRRPPITVA